MKRKIVIAAFLYVALVGAAIAASPTAEQARTTGDIKGTVNICSLLGLDTVIAYIPGRSFMLRPAADGSFEFNFVPPGSYEIKFASESGEVVSTLSGVVVDAKQATNLGEVSICIDADGDGFDATLDCNDSDPAIHPDATEVCNLVDDNCDTLIDEGFPTLPFYPDMDHDSWGDTDKVVQQCTRPSGYVANGGDCYDDNHYAYPGSPYWSGVHRGDGSYDYNCNSTEELRYSDGIYCKVDIPGYPTGTCTTVGSGFWSASSTTLDDEPGCGITGPQFVGCRKKWEGTFGTNLVCENRSVATHQECR